MYVLEINRLRYLYIGAAEYLSTNGIDEQLVRCA